MDLDDAQREKLLGAFEKMEAGFSVLSHAVMDLHERITAIEQRMARRDAIDPPNPMKVVSVTCHRL
jgi:hypothetical protein